MKILLCAGAVILLLSGGADAKSGAAKAAQQAQPHGKADARTARRVRKPAPAKDPYAEYWKDPYRYQVPTSYFRGGW